MQVKPVIKVSFVPPKIDEHDFELKVITGAYYYVCKFCSVKIWYYDTYEGIKWLDSECVENACNIINKNNIEQVRIKSCKYEKMNQALK